MSYDLKDPVALSTGVTDGSQFFGALSEEAPLPSAFLASALWEYVAGKIVGTYPVFFPTTGIPDNDVGVDGSVAIDYAAGLSYVKEAGAWGGATAMRLRPRGAYGGATAYLVGDVVTDQSASWVNLAASTGVAPPTLPTETSATWALLAKSSEVEAEAAIAAAEAARDAAEAARDAAFANASVYADIATGRSAVADGAQFMVVSGDEIIRYRRDTSSTQTEMARYPTSQIVGTDYQIGWASPVATGTLTATGYTVIMQQAFAVDTVISQVTVGTTSAGVGKLLVVSMSGTTVSAIHQTIEIDLVAGVNVIPVAVHVAAGQHIGFSNRLLYNSGSGNPAQWVKSSAVSVGAVMAASSAYRFEIQYEASDGLIGDIADHEYRIDACEASAEIVGGTQLLGWIEPIVGTGSDTASNYTMVLQEAVDADGWVTEIKVGKAAAGTLTVHVVDVTGTTLTTIQSSTSITVSAGVTEISCAIPVEAGQFVAITGSMKFQAFTNPLLVPIWAFVGTLADGVTLTAGTQHRFEVSYTVKSGLVGSYELISSGATVEHGLGLLSDADKNGVVDATAVFASARASHPHPYVPVGQYAVTALSASGSGLYGPGVVRLGGKRFFLPTRADQVNLHHSLRAALAPEIATGAPVVLIGDSISHWSAASSAAAHWFNQFTAFANIFCSPTDEPVMTALRPSSTYTPAFYGVTTSGSVSTGTNGPIGESIVLAAGASLSFTGAYEQVDAFYTQQSGAGSLAFAYNGGAAYKTVSCSGATELDKFTGPSLTGQIASGSYTITATGGPVEITGLVRLGIKASGTTRLVTHRSAHGSYLFPSFGAAAVASIVKQCSAFSATPPTVLLALGINDRAALAAGNYAAMKTRAQTLVDLLQAGGVTRMAAVMPQEPTSGWSATFTGKITQAELWGALAEVYRAEGVQILPTHQFDAAGEGLLSDGLHPNDAGNAKMAQVIIEALGQ